jgi:hypothetical protein
MRDALRALDERDWPTPVRTILRPVARPVLRISKRLEARRAHRATDAYILSYPKSGRTWLRMLVGQAIVLQRGLTDVFPTDLEAITGRLDDLPTIRVIHDDPSYKDQPRPYYTRKRDFRDKTVVFVARDPRDVVVSFYYHLSRRGLSSARDGDAPIFDGPLVEFVRHPRFGIDPLLDYMNGWLAAREVPRRFVLVRYEDLHADAAGELKRVLDVLGITGIDDDVVARAVESGSFDAMRALEQRGDAPVPELRPVGSDDPAALKTRRGVVGGFRDELPADEADALTRHVAERLDPGFGYRFDV